MSESISYVGMDVHKNSVKICLLPPGRREPVQWQERHTPQSIRRLSRRLLRESGGELLCCYEAGPTGYGLLRQLEGAGIPCQVIAPSLTPVRPGSRVKTDRRDAKKLAELLRAGLLTEVHPPNAQDEALRDLCRCREDVRLDLTRARHRMSKFLLRHHCIYTQTKRHWGTRHMAWLRQVRFGEFAAQATFDSYLLAIDQLEERLGQIELQMDAFAAVVPYADPVAWLRCFRGIDTITALSLIAELHTFQRFPSPRKLMAYLGLVPSEDSSGETQHRGSITKTGNRHVRRLLVEAAWNNRHRPSVPLPLRKRREGQPARVIAIADRAQQRLHRRYLRMIHRGKPHQKVIIAMARELAGYLWAVVGPQAQSAETRPA
jgi:transposase